LIFTVANTASAMISQHQRWTESIYSTNY